MGRRFEKEHKQLIALTFHNHPSVKRRPEVNCFMSVFAGALSAFVCLCGGSLGRGWARKSATGTPIFVTSLIESNGYWLAAG